VFELLIAAAIGAYGAYAAPECEIGFEKIEETRQLLRLRPACPVGHASTQNAVRAILHPFLEASALVHSHLSPRCDPNLVNSPRVYSPSNLTD